MSKLVIATELPTEGGAVFRASADGLTFQERARRAADPRDDSDRLRLQPDRTVQSVVAGIFELIQDNDRFSAMALREILRAGPESELLQTYEPYELGRLALVSGITELGLRTVFHRREGAAEGVGFETLEAKGGYTEPEAPYNSYYVEAEVHKDHDLPSLTIETVRVPDAAGQAVDRTSARIFTLPLVAEARWNPATDAFRALQIANLTEWSIAHHWGSDYQLRSFA